MSWHSIAVAARPEAVWDALKTADFARSWTLRALLTARGIGRSHIDLNTFIDREFVLLEESPPTRPRAGYGGSAPSVPDRPCSRRPVQGGMQPVSLFVSGGSSALRITAATRRFAPRRVSRRPITRGLRAFRRYWRFIKPFSGLTRTAMLRAIKRAAEGSPVSSLRPPGTEAVRTSRQIDRVPRRFCPMDPDGNAYLLHW